MIMTDIIKQSPQSFFLVLTYPVLLFLLSVTDQVVTVLKVAPSVVQTINTVIN